MICCGLPICSSSGKKRPRAPKGRDRREQEYARQHPDCERCGKPMLVVHHRQGRKMGGWNRKLSPLEALCFDCDQAEHRNGRREPIKA